MNFKDFGESRNGVLRKAPGGYWVFIPNSLPDQITYSPSVGALLSIADRKVGKLEGICHRLPNPHLLSGAYINREAVLSSRIEGTQSTESDLFLSEISEPTTSSEADIREVQNYVRALNHGTERRKTLPLSLRLLQEMHKELMSGVRGGEQTPGEFRRTQNWILGSNPSSARYVPPPPEELYTSLGQLEAFMHRKNPEQIPVLLECAMVHYQFEAIHPFLDGNGRLGRLLIILLCIERNILPHPLLYMSGYFERNRTEYFDHLLDVSQRGNWDEWFAYFLKGAAEQADDAANRAVKVIDTYTEFTSFDVSPTARRLVDVLMRNPFTTLKSASQILNVTPAAASRAVTQLVETGVLKTFGPVRQRGQLYVAERLLTAYTSNNNS